MASNQKSLSVDELTRLAFVWAEQDRASLAQCWPEGSKERSEAQWQAAQLKQHRLKKWGRIVADKLDSTSTISLVDINPIVKRPTP